jgi:hypothetical protein
LRRKKSPFALQSCTLWRPFQIRIFVKQILQKLSTGSEWLLFSANSNIFQLYHGENK